MRKNLSRFMLAPIVASIALMAAGVTYAAPSSLGAFGWATNNGGTTGGHGATKANTYTVTSRAQLIKALMPDAVINADGTFTSAAGPSATKKIIYIKGKINLSQNGAGQELKFEHYKDPAYDFNAYVAAYKPSVWNANPANWDAARNRPFLPSGPLEEARQRSSAKQSAVVRIPVGSNTSIIGLDRESRITNGQLSISGVSNVVIRNVTFEDAFDHFPEWDPTDSFSLTTPASPGCQATYVDASTGPQKCPGGRWNTEYDNVQIVNSKNIWVDHCTFNDGNREDWKYPSVFEAPHVGTDYMVVRHDGALDVTGASDFVTISYNLFENHDKTNLLGSSNTATPANGWGQLSVTVAYNWYEKAGQRLPRVRFGKVHVYNNYLFGQIGHLGQYAPQSSTTVIPPNRFLYGIGIGNFAKIYAENNVFEIKDAPPAPYGTGQKADISTTFFNWYGANATVDGVLQKTYFYDAGTIFNGKPASIFNAAQAMAVTQNKPPLESTPTIWTPSSNYGYSLLPSSQVKNHVQAKAGAGKI